MPRTCDDCGLPLLQNPCIIENHWRENGQKVSCDDDQAYEVAPTKMVAKPFGDILKEKVNACLRAKIYELGLVKL